MTDPRTDLLAAASDALEYFEQHQDTRDGPDGQPQPNEEMQLAQRLRTAIEGVEKS